jgi:Spy/CpxP family protein refolding chaperone
MVRSLLIGVAALLFLWVSMPLAFSQTSPARRMPEPSPCSLMALRFLRQAAVPRLTKDLNLSEEQVSKITDLLKRAEEAMKPKIEEQRQATKDFVLALANPNASEDDLINAFRKVSKSEEAIAAESIKVLVAIRNLLTEEQKLSLSKILESRTRPWQGITVPSPAQVTDSASGRADEAESRNGK